MKTNEAYRILTEDGWKTVSQKGSHRKMTHSTKKVTIIFPYHGNQEIGKGLLAKLFKQAGIKIRKN